MANLRTLIIEKNLPDILIDSARMSLGFHEDLKSPLRLSLSFLHSIEIPSEIPGVPSWVPDYRLPEEFNVLESVTELTSVTHLNINIVEGHVDVENVLYLF